MALDLTRQYLIQEVQLLLCLLCPLARLPHFCVDRLGIGKSSHGDPKNEIQTALEVESLAQIPQMIRNGNVPGLRKKPSKILHVGHSFGSVQSYA
ncbi:unnamed protein product [Penicillium salamii]|uniref:AB hydrolase-1 domain-containing protein n=1 Tax=Penicillium salamii TaxID=1612424 RepID=A0A9W4J4S0_9EURO|nr:unnamed protein product [Penicillium salamii]CAG8009072.1 unnamed protein product [Penicillium salamii]CAG8023060.1 unnamed protein product [Penicillium salamii]CAG8118636.1 unnamed protein product [Penicillium salamii]CAG8336406.1 unnamed protein product [Penicillium salamii]